MPRPGSLIRGLASAARWTTGHLSRPSAHYQRQTPAVYRRHLSTSHHCCTERRKPGFSRTADTIYALSSAQGKAGIAVIRVSGPSCLEIYKSLCPSKPPPKPRFAAVRTLLHPEPCDASPVVLDSSALVLYFPAPATVTGEDVLELHVHGGAATVKAVLAALPRCAGRVRHAEPGEFTQRAFVHDRLDLAQVEALGDALAAETEQQRRAAVRGSSGRLGRTYEGWRARLLLARGELEALIDFAEDQHLDESPADLLASVARQVREMRRGIARHERGAERSELLRSGIRIALVGPPNVGKSSLMNLVVGREASIVSGEAGTTRDVVEASLDIRGYLCSFADTAGFRTNGEGGGGGGGGGEIGAVEQEGIRRARSKAEEADIVVVLASVETSAAGEAHIRYDEQTLQLAAEADSRLVLVNKRDAVDPETLRALLSGFRTKLRGKLQGIDVHAVSCKEAQDGSSSTTTGGAVGDGTDPGGVHAVIDVLAGRFAAMTTLPAGQQDLLGVTERQRQLLADCRGHLEAFLAEAEAEEADSVLAAEFLRYAADCLSRITGRGEGGDVEEVLGVVFEKFCVGK